MKAKSKETRTHCQLAASYSLRPAPTSYPAMVTTGPLPPRPSPGPACGPGRPGRAATGPACSPPRRSLPSVLPSPRSRTRSPTRTVTFLPSARAGPSHDTVAVRVEVHAASRGAFDNDAVRIDIVRVGETAVALTVPGQLAGTIDPLRRVATTLVDIRGLPRGDYIMHVRLDSADGQVLAQASRLFRKE